MDKKTQIESLERFISLIKAWFDFRNRGKFEEMEKAGEDLQSEWGVIEEIFKQIGLTYSGQLYDYEEKGVKNPIGDYFIDGFIGGQDDRPKVYSILKLKALASSAKTKIQTAIPLVINTLPSVNQVINILNRFPDVLSRLTHRRSGKIPLNIEDEYDMQDIIYVMLKGPFPTLQYEDPNRKVGTTSSTIDFIIDELGLFLETKFISVKGKEKEIQKQCREDIISYGNQTNCFRIIFLIFDPNHSIDNEYAFKSGLEGHISIGDKEIEVTTLIIH